MVRTFLYIVLFFLGNINIGYCLKQDLMDGEITSTYLYPNSEIIFTVKVFRHGNMGTSIPSDPIVSGPGEVTLHKLSYGPKMSVIENGIKYDVATYRYALFVSKPGKYEILPMVLEASIGVDSYKYTTKYTVFEVLAPPKSIEKNWKSALSLDVSDSIIATGNKIHVGDTLRRSLNIEAVGASGRFFSKINFPEIEAVRTYKNPTKDKEVYTDENVIIKQRYDFIYIPQKPGKITIPSIQIKWLNLKTNIIETRYISQKYIDVLPLETKDKGTKIDRSNKISTFTINNFYIVMVLVSFVFLLILIYNRYSKKIYERKIKKNALEELKIACDNNNIKKVIENTLYVLSLMEISECNNMGEMANLFNDEKLKRHVASINEAMFKNNKEWDSSGYFDAFVNAIDKYKKQKNEIKFPKLYPFS